VTPVVALGVLLYANLVSGEEARPVVLLVIAIDPDVLFQGLISVLSLPVTFQMISRGEMQLHIQCHAEGPEEVRDEL